jgi:tripartite ATP-independent transporter DctP family solute receptor
MLSRLIKKTAIAVTSGLYLLGAGAAFADEKVTLVGAALYDDSHVFNRALLKFEELVKEYYGKPIEFVLHRNGELGTDKDYFQFMSQGISIDYAIVAPSHMSTFVKEITLVDMPFLFRDQAHWDATLASGVLDPITEKIKEKTGVMVLGFAGGGVRNVIANTPVRNMEELSGLQIRVMGAPIQSESFKAAGASPQPLAWSEIYNALQTGVVDGAENEAAGISSSKIYEVAPHVALTQHTITVRPLAFSGEKFASLPEDLQAAIIKAGREAAKYGRDLESKEDSERLSELASQGLVTVHEFSDRAELMSAVEPVRKNFAESVGATPILEAVQAVK